jgi:hypothetical protein
MDFFSTWTHHNLLYQSSELYATGELYTSELPYLPKQQGDVALKAHVENVCSSVSCFRGLQVFYMDVAKVDQVVAYAASVSETCCKRLFKVFHLF